MTTIQAVLDLARDPLNDADKVRYSDADLLKFANAAIRRIYQVRPDLRFGAYTTPVTDLVISSVFPLPAEYAQAVADYITFRAESRDDEHVDSNRVTVFLNSFNQAILS